MISFLFKITIYFLFFIFFSGEKNLKSENIIKIHANNMEIRKKESIIILKGNVSILKGDVLLKSGKIVFFYGKRGGIPAEDLSQENFKSIDIKRIEASEKVYIKFGNQSAIGEEGFFDVQENKIVLNREVVFSNKNNIATGCKLIFYIKRGKAILENCSKNSKKRVSITIDSKK